MVRKQIFLIVLMAGLPTLFVGGCNTGTSSPKLVLNSFAFEAARVPKAATDADFAAHVEQLKKKLPSADFTIVIQPPFVVIGDEPAATVREHSQNTVKWAVDKLKREYFSADPKEILDIWLFKDSASYEKNVQLLFG